MSFLQKGKEKEKLFGSIFNDIIFSNKSQDINEHWDLKLEFKIDVKSLKKISRSDIETNEFYHFIELKNVLGKLGWLYGKADYFAFETNEYWILVSKAKLQDFISQKITKKYVSNVDESLYCLYTRNGRKDVITMVKTIDLMFIADEIILKTNDIIKHDIGDSIIQEKRNQQKLNKALSKK